MGTTLHLGFNDSLASENGAYDSKSFFSEIVSPSYPDYFNLDDFLTEEEQKLLYPKYYNYEYEDVNKYQHIPSAELKGIFLKIYNYLKDNHHKFPLTHFISEKNHLGSGSSDRFYYKGYECYIDGFHHNYEHRFDVCIMAWQDKWKPLEWIEASSQIIVNDKIFYILSSNKFEEFKDILEELIGICEVAIRKLIWLFST